MGGLNLKGNNLAVPNHFRFKFNLSHLGTAPAEAGGAVPR